MKTLENEGLPENTLIIFSTDNRAVLKDANCDEATEKSGSMNRAVC